MYGYQMNAVYNISKICHTCKSCQMYVRICNTWYSIYGVSPQQCYI